MFSSDLKRKKWRLILLAVLVMVVSVLPGKAFHAWYNKETGGVLCGGKPKILWIAMGTEPYYNNAAGWYNGCSDWLFSEAGYDPEKATELGKAKIRDNIYIFRHNPDTAYEFFSGKLESMWCDPMYESLWSGPLPDAGAENKTEFLMNFIREKYRTADCPGDEGICDHAVCSCNNFCCGSKKQEV